MFIALLTGKSGCRTATKHAIVVNKNVNAATRSRPDEPITIASERSSRPTVIQSVISTHWRFGFRKAHVANATKATIANNIFIEIEGN